MREFTKSGRYFCWAVIKLWWPFVCFFLLDSIEFAQKYLHIDVHMPAPVTPVLLWGGLLWAAIKTYHDVRMQNVGLTTQLSTRPPTRLAAFNAFLNGALSHLDRLQQKSDLTRADVIAWRDSLSSGLHQITGHDPMDNRFGETIPFHRLIQVIDQLPSESPNRDFLREPFGRCRTQLEELRRSIRPEHFATTFDPGELPQWEDT